MESQNPLWHSFSGDRQPAKRTYITLKGNLGKDLEMEILCVIGTGIIIFQVAVNLNEEPWRGYARKEIARQIKLKTRAQMIANQQGMQ